MEGNAEGRRKVSASSLSALGIRAVGRPVPGQKTPSPLARKAVTCPQAKERSVLLEGGFNSSKDKLGERGIVQGEGKIPKAPMVS